MTWRVLPLALLGLVACSARQGPPVTSSKRVAFAQPAPASVASSTSSDRLAPAPASAERTVVRAPDPATWTPSDSPLLAASDEVAEDGASPSASAAADAWAGGLTERPPRLDGPELAATDVYAKVRDSVFFIVAGKTYDDAIARRGELRAGSAVAVSKHVMITNCHVVDAAKAVVAYSRSGFVRVRLVKRHEPSDRCALEVVDQRELVPIAGVRGPEDLKVGERVYSVGSPQGFESTLGEGIVSGLHEVKSLGMTLIQTTAQISRGSSGGGLFDARGNLIGITTLKHTGGEALNFAIPAAAFWTK